jgi:hypothetical protein
MFAALAVATGGVLHLQMERPQLLRRHILARGRIFLADLKRLGCGCHDRFPQ